MWFDTIKGKGSRGSGSRHNTKGPVKDEARRENRRIRREEVRSAREEIEGKQYPKTPGKSKKPKPKRGVPNATTLDEMFDRKRRGRCASCGIKVNVDDFRDERSKQEFRQSGFCQECQDDFFR